MTSERQNCEYKNKFGRNCHKPSVIGKYCIIHWYMMKRKKNIKSEDEIEKSTIEWK